MKRPTITLEKWTQTADTVWLDSRTSAVVTTIDRNGQVTRANHSADCANARAIASVPALLAALEEMLDEARQAGIDTMPGDDFAGFNIACENAKAALIQAGYTF